MKANPTAGVQVPCYHHAQPNSGMVGNVPLPSTNSSPFSTSPYKAPGPGRALLPAPLLLCPRGEAAVWTQALRGGCLRAQHEGRTCIRATPKHLGRSATAPGGRHIHTPSTPCSSKLKARCSHYCCSCGRRKKTHAKLQEVVV